MNKLILDFANVTEKAALAAYPWIGKGNKNEADRASTEAMRKRLNAISMDGRIVIGEGEMDEAPMLYIGERLGTGKGPSLEIAVDPLDGTSLIAKGRENSIAVMAVTPKGGLLSAPDMYMEKIAVGSKARGIIDLDAPLIENMKAVAKAKGKDVSDLTITVQERKRHEKLINSILQYGASVKLFDDVDVTGAICAALDHGKIDLFLGIGGAPEGVVSAAAVKALGGDFQGRLLPTNDAETERCRKMGIVHCEQKLTADEIVRSDEGFFVATGVTDGLLLDGVQPIHGKQMTHSLIIDGTSDSYHFMESIHRIPSRERLVSDSVQAD
ncbi:class II fructose-bisphosphatase [Paludifilum halophilum]|uniref:Fructose-1,6-bisphosphatase n=1 Tax=Paludifilum halophilum TaxID=1642702 RepID=A0A235B535_9BACL|nr:class II fructose-bisphosphatase [Paludifilum halophilum]OYD07418.1 fructose-bisphosphatase class II [Paludifilum halophilum]